MSVRPSVFVTQFEGESHGNELGIAVPHELRARRVAGVHDPQLDRRRRGARQRNGLVAQRHFGAARRPAALGGLFAGLQPAVGGADETTQLMAGSRADARAPSGCSRPSAARRSRPAPARARALAPSAPIAQVERFTDAIGYLPEASDTLRRGCVEHVVKSGKIAPQAAPDLILNLHRSHGSEVAS